MQNNTFQLLTEEFGISPKVLELVGRAEEKTAAKFAELDDIKAYNQYKVLDVFRRNKISDRHFAWNTGYGYDDAGREALESVYADTHISREQVITMLYRYAEKKGLDLSSFITAAEDTSFDLKNAVVQKDYTTMGGDLDRFPDGAEVSDYAKRAMQWAVSEGIITGTPDGNLNPQGSVTRAEIAAMLARYNN